MIWPLQFNDFLVSQRATPSYRSKKNEFERKLAETDVYLQVLIKQVEVRCLLCAYLCLFVRANLFHDCKSGPLMFKFVVRH